MMPFDFCKEIVTKSYITEPLFVFWQTASNQLLPVTIKTTTIQLVELIVINILTKHTCIIATDYESRVILH